MPTEIAQQKEDNLVCQNQQIEDGTAQQQSIFLVRHGARYDYENPTWLKTTIRPGDPPLSDVGNQQARETGIFLDELFVNEGIKVGDITWLSSPFLRCLQTSNIALENFRKLNGGGKNSLRILPEYSVFEWDGHNGKWHESLPPVQERVHYFPRVDVTYESLFVPTLPEPRANFLDRCEHVIQQLTKRYPFRPRSVIVIVTHAAACIGLAKAATNLTLSSITPAAPCGIYRLTRTSDTPLWRLDPHDHKQSMNGYTDHLSDLSIHTTPWNHFGEKSVFSGYTGPLNSRFAPTNHNTKR